LSSIKFVRNGNEEGFGLKKRSSLRLRFLPIILFLVPSLLTGCGKNFYFAGRNLPPSGLTNRVLIAIQNPSAFTNGALTFVDAYYDIRHAYNNQNVTFSISGASVSLPLTIQNMPEEQLGAVYNQSNGSLSLINYSSEKQNTSISGSPAASIFISRNQEYVLSADQTAHYVVITDETLGKTIPLNLPGVNHVSLNPSGTIGLAFVQNSDTAYSLVHLTGPQQQAAAQSPDPQHYQPAGALQPAQDCEPRNLPIYCVFPITTPAGTSFDRPVKALFSPDGSSIYVLNCGPECGGGASGITTIPITTASINTGGLGPSGLNFQASATYSLPGGATNAIGNGNTLYVAGQSIQPDGYLAGNLTVFSFTNNQIVGTYPIADGSHNKMLFADDNTLFIGAQQCQSGERYHLNPASNAGCLTMFNTSNNSVVGFDTYKGDLTGIADVEGLHKIYVAEGGQIYIYSTTNFAALDNSNVTVVGTASDVAYMDGTSDENNTTY
jgi:hypothetical protein